MSYCDVVCHDCNGDMVCLTCEAQDTVVCPGCSREVRIPWRERLMPETFDPELVRTLVDNILDNSFGLPRQLLADAAAIRSSERKP